PLAAQRFEGVVGKRLRAGARAVYAEQRGVRAFAKNGVAAGCLAKLATAGCNIEHIVHDLEGEADIVTKALERSRLGSARPRGECSHSYRTNDQSASLGGVNLFA